MTIDRETLEAALIGYEAERRKIEERIADVQSRLKGKAPTQISEKKARGGKRTMSAEGRARIIAAAKKRWAAVRKAAKAKPAAKAAKRKPAKKVAKAKPAPVVQAVA